MVEVSFFKADFYINCYWYFKTKKSEFVVNNYVFGAFTKKHLILKPINQNYKILVQQ